MPNFYVVENIKWPKEHRKNIFCLKMAHKNPASTYYFIRDFFTLSETFCALAKLHVFYHNLETLQFRGSRWIFVRERNRENHLDYCAFFYNISVVLAATICKIDILIAFSHILKKLPKNSKNISNVRFHLFSLKNSLERKENIFLLHYYDKLLKSRP